MAPMLGPDKKSRMHALVRGRRHPRSGPGAGAAVLPFVKVGSDSIVGAGAIVHRDVDARPTVVGIPAKAVEARV